MGFFQRRTNVTTPDQHLNSTDKAETYIPRHASQDGSYGADAEEHIRLRAYQLSLYRRQHPGDEMQDWLAAARDYHEGILVVVSDQPRELSHDSDI
jgi:hypothetical protein